MDVGKIYMGHWWLPEKEKYKVTGNLMYNSKSQSYRLRTIGNFKNNQRNPFFSDDYKMIIGLAKDEISNKNFSFKLLDGFATKIGPGDYYEFVVNSFLICPGEEVSIQLLFNRIYLKVTYIDEWFANSGFNITELPKEKFGYQIEYRQPREILLYKTEEYTITGIFRASINYPLYTDLTAEQSAYILLTFNSIQTLEDLKKFSLVIKNFFCLAIGLPLRYEDFEVGNMIDQDNPTTFTYYQDDRNKNLIKRNIRSFGMPINFKDHKSSFSNILKSWFYLHEKYVLSVLNFFSVINENRGFEEDQFLNLVIAIETYQRKKYPDFGIKNEKFLEIRNRVLSQIEGNDKQWLSKHLRTHAQKTLKDRLGFILDNHQESLEGLISDQKQFINIVVETRHHFVHEEVNSMHLVLKGGENLNVMNATLKIILEAVFLSELGFESGLITKKLKSNQYNLQAFDDARF